MGDSGPRGVVRLFDLASGKPLQDFRTDKDVWYSNGAFLPNGRQLVTAYSSDKNVYLWDVAMCKLVREFQGHTADGVTAVVSHDGDRLASSGKDDTLRLWQLSTGQEVWTQNVPGEQIGRVVFSPDDRLLLTSGADRTLRIREVKTGSVTATLEGHTAGCAGDFSPDGKQVLSWGDDGQVRVWDIRTAKTLQTFEGRPEAVRHAWLLDGGRQVLTWGKDLAFRVSDAATGRTVREIKIADMMPPGWNEAVLSPDGHRLLVVNSDGADVRLVDLYLTRPEVRSWVPKSSL
ncbi:MAG TPA: WD40 repeat domain-containing protein [Pirellulales bacterium]|nr:WD40 repeat domain-containing protein [Pirellulales bacterium]